MNDAAGEAEPPSRDAGDAAGTHDSAAHPHRPPPQPATVDDRAARPVEAHQPHDNGTGATSGPAVNGHANGHRGAASNGATAGPVAMARPRGKPPVLQPVQRLPSWRREAKQAAPALHRPRPFINLCGDYRFLRAGYWALVDAELNGVESSPTPIQAVTAQNAAACLLIARHAGIPTVEWKVARKPQDVEPPALLVPVAGLTDAVYEVKSTRSRAAQWRSATQNGTRPALVVKLSGELRSMRMIVGVTAHDNYHLAWDVWRAFGVPLAQIWYVETGGGENAGGSNGPNGPDGPESSKPLFVGLDPLPLHELTERELRLFEEVSQRPMERDAGDARMADGRAGDARPVDARMHDLRVSDGRAGDGRLRDTRTVH